MPAFVLEIGAEELPSRFLLPVENELSASFCTTFKDAGLFFSGLSCCSTPRRLVLHIDHMADAAITREEIVTGPSLKVAYDMGGRPTRAAEGFARTQKVNLEDAFTLETEKGAYLAVRRRVGGGGALDILSAVCPALITSLPFPKRMHWGDVRGVTFARPIRWILALFGEVVVPFSVGGVPSGAVTYGHRVHGPGPFTVPHAADYFDVMENTCGVVARNNDRERIIKEQGTFLATESQGRILWKKALLEEVQGLCERPVPLLGAFDPSYLEVPREVLLTSMENHQKSFGLEGEGGRLLPYFLTVLNLVPEDPALVKKGWERVLRARLEDARFFWKSDLAVAGFDGWLRVLDSVIFLAPLGSMGDKTRRIEALCAWLADNTRSNLQEPIPSVADAMRAGRLSKADLVSEMVKEFDTLQGIMGGIYAERFGESPAVAAALREQYLPTGPDSPVPASLCGAFVSLADKADTLAGCFGLGMIPTGATDPYGLRRAALGIARIAQEKDLRFDVTQLFAKAMEGYAQRDWRLEPEHALARLADFFTLRLKNHFVANGAETLLAEAILQAGAKDVWAASARLAALAVFSRTPDFAQSVLIFKRASNIIRKYMQEAEAEAEPSHLNGEYRAELFSDAAEKALATELERVDPLFLELWRADRYAELFALLRDLRPFVDAFFDQVMVLCDEKAVRLNRLALLRFLVGRLERLADFSALQI